MDQYFKNQRLLAESLMNGVSEFDNLPRDPMPSDEEIDEMYTASKSQTESEAYRLSH
jgi:hypothetical protein